MFNLTEAQTHELADLSILMDSHAAERGDAYWDAQELFAARCKELNSTTGDHRRIEALAEFKSTGKGRAPIF